MLLLLHLSAADWARGEWVWFVRLANSRTLWEVWNRAFEQHRAKLLSASGERQDGSAQPSNQLARVATASRAHSSAPTSDPSLWMVLTGSRDIGVDTTNTANANTRRTAAAAHDEDWFINFANKLFEL